MGRWSKRIAIMIQYEPKDLTLLEIKRERERGERKREGEMERVSQRVTSEK